MPNETLSPATGRVTTARYYTPTSDASTLDVARDWGWPALLLFRFWAVYFALYVVVTQMLGALVQIPKWGFRPLESHGPTQALIIWTAEHVFGAHDFVRTLSGSGDKVLDYVQVVLGLLAAAVATTVWSIWGRARRDERDIAKWLRAFLRFALGASMISYGFVKLVPLQMPAPNLFRLVETYGDLSPMGVLWASIGSSQPYEMFTGSVEVLSGALLFFPQTWLLGALVSLAATTQIFMLNMTYDVPVKLFSLHLVLMSAFLLAPECRRLLNTLILNRTAEPSRAAPLFASATRQRWAQAIQIVFGLYLMSMDLYGSSQSWTRFGGGAPKPPLYGLYDVTELSKDGHPMPVVLNDPARWRRVIIERGPVFGWQTMDDKVTRMGAKIDTTQHTIALTLGDSSRSSIRYNAYPDGSLRFDGQVAGHHMEGMMALVDVRQRFLLLHTGFHWVQERPFNR